MFDQSQRIAELVDGIHEILTNMKRGDVVPHESIEAIVGCERNTPRYTHCMNMARRRLELIDGIATWPQKPEGFRLLTEHDQLHELPNWRRRKAKRQHTKAERSLLALPDRGLSVHQRHVRLAQIEKLQRASLEIEREIRDSNPAKFACVAIPRPTRPLKMSPDDTVKAS